MSAIDSPIAPSPPRRDLSWRWPDVAALLAVLFVSLCFRVAGIDATPSADEIWHLALSRGEGSPVGVFAPDVAYVNAPSLTSLAGAAPIWHIWTHMDGVLHPPLYVVALRLWREIFGASDAAGHALSIAFSMVAIAFCFATARLALGRGAAIWASLVVAVSPVQVYLAQEIRGYEMMIALGAIALWLATRIEVVGPTPRRAASMAIVALPLLLTHYFAAGGVIGLAIYAIVRLHGRPRRAFVATATFASVTFAVVWLPLAARQIKSLDTGDAFARVPDIELLREVPWALSLPARLIVERPWLGGTISGLFALMLGIALLAVPWYRLHRLPLLLPWATWLTSSVAVLVVLDVARTTWLVQLVRYAAIASPAVPLLLVAVPASFGSRAMHVAAAALLTLMLVSRPPNDVTVADSPQFGGSARWLNQRIAPGDAILVVEGAGGEHVADLVLMTLAHEPGLFPRTVVKVKGPLRADALAALPDRAWAVMVDRHEPLGPYALRSATLLQSNGVAGEGIYELFDLTTAKRETATPPQTR